MRNCKNKEQGFTLIEVLVAITLLSLILLLLFNSLFTTSRSWQVGQSRIDDNTDIRITSQFLRKYINQAIPIQWQHKGKKQLLFIGNENELTFITNLPAHRGGGGLSLIRFTVSDNTRKSLLVQYQYADPGQIESILEKGPNKETVLLEDIEQIEFRYYGQKELNELEDWHSDWQDADQMPKAIAMHIIQNNRSHTWPELVIHIPNQIQYGLQEFVIRSSSQASNTIGES